MDNFYVIGNSTTLNGLATSVLFLAVINSLFLSRKLVVVVFIVVACSMTIGQQLVVASVHFTVFRLLVIAAWVRVLLRREIWLEKLTIVDKALITWVAIGTVAPIIRMGSTEAFINAAGHAFDAIGLFFIFRFTVRKFEDVLVAIKAIAVMMPLLMLFMSTEKLIGMNLFSVFGGVPEHAIVREGYLRAQGPFRHPILAGSFATTSIPLLAAFWNIERGANRRLSAVALVAATLIMVLSASSSPVLTYIVAVLSIGGWILRKKVRELWYLFLVGLLVLASFMKAPIWFLIDRASDVIGGGGYHRSIVIDAAIRHFGEWWLLGTSHTEHWLPNVLWFTQQADITNAFVGEGVSGGILTLSAFVFLVGAAFKTSLAEVQEDSSSARECRVAWGLWSSLLCHTVTFFSISYFDQMQLFWFLLLACISSLNAEMYPIGKTLRGRLISQVSGAG